MRAYYQQNKERFLEELYSILRIPSISALEENKPDMQRCAQAFAELLKEAGAERAEVFPTTGHPVVYGESIIDPKLKTVLI